MKTHKKTKTNTIIADFLETISDVDQKKTDRRMLIATQISAAIKAKGWKKKELIVAMGKKNPSEVTKWLSGTHNFTVDILVELEHVLGIEFFQSPPKEESTLLSGTFYSHLISCSLDTNKTTFPTA